MPPRGALRAALRAGLGALAPGGRARARCGGCEAGGGGLARPLQHAALPPWRGGRPAEDNAHHGAGRALHHQRPTGSRQQGCRLRRLIEAGKQAVAALRATRALSQEPQRGAGPQAPRGTAVHPRQRHELLELPAGRRRAGGQGAGALPEQHLRDGLGARSRWCLRREAAAGGRAPPRRRRSRGRGLHRGAGGRGRHADGRANPARRASSHLGRLGLCQHGQVRGVHGFARESNATAQG
mmetsp:Transcript_132258/g.411111  ORF Transcript_132258/g.411111 Transcript_132258/m.411111 type:complete len:239 (-) Transcript_132258:434-1150(-)